MKKLITVLFGLISLVSLSQQNSRNLVDEFVAGSVGNYDLSGRIFYNETEDKYYQFCTVEGKATLVIKDRTTTSSSTFTLLSTVGATILDVSPVGDEFYHVLFKTYVNGGDHYLDNHNYWVAKINVSGNIVESSGLPNSNENKYEQIVADPDGTFYTSRATHISNKLHYYQSYESFQSKNYIEKFSYTSGGLATRIWVSPLSTQCDGIATRDNIERWRANVSNMRMYDGDLVVSMSSTRNDHPNLGITPFGATWYYKSYRVQTNSGSMSPIVNTFTNTEAGGFQTGYDYYAEDILINGPEYYHIFIKEDDKIKIYKETKVCDVCAPSNVETLVLPLIDYSKHYHLNSFKNNFKVKETATHIFIGFITTPNDFTTGYEDYTSPSYAVVQINKATLSVEDMLTYSSDLNNTMPLEGFDYFSDFDFVKQSNSLVVTGTVNSAGRSHSDFKEAQIGVTDIRTIVSCPTVNRPNISRNFNVCEGETVDFNVLNLQTGVDYEWTHYNGISTTVSTGNSFTINSIKPNHTLTAKGISGICESTSENALTSYHIDVIAKPDPVTVNTPHDFLICSGDPITINVTDIDQVGWDGQIRWGFEHFPAVGSPTKFISLSNGAQSLTNALQYEDVTYKFYNVIQKCASQIGQFTCNDAVSCWSDGVTVTTIIKPEVVIAFSPAPPLCLASADFDLSTLTSTPGVTFSGTGVFNGKTFRSSLAGVNNHILTWNHTDAVTGCTQTGNIGVSVTSSGSVVHNIPNIACTGDDAFRIDALPSTGTWTVLSASPNGTIDLDFFYPKTAKQGTHILRYDYNDNGCAVTVDHSITVFEEETVTFNSIGSFCTGDDHIVLTPFASPSGGTFSGQGVSNGIFYPSQIKNAGTYTLEYTFQGQGCKIVKSITVDVNESATILPTFIPNLCKDDAIINLEDYVSPTGGAFRGKQTGSGVIGKQFNPSSLVGPNEVITYTYENTSGCKSTEEIIITVNALPVVTQNPFGSRCDNDVLFQLTGGSPSGGIYTGNGVSAGFFNPQNAGVGVHSITYTVNDAIGCAGTTTKNITINNTSNVIFNPIGDLCVGGSSVNLLNFVNPSTGTFSGNGVIGSIFNPALAGVGSSLIEFNFLDPVTGCTVSKSQTVTVVSTVQVTDVIQPSLCNNGGLVDLRDYVSPSTGIYTGIGVVGNNFNPAVAGVGTHQVNFAYQSSNGCTQNHQFNIEVNSTPTVTLPNVNNFCTNEPGYLLPDATISGSPAGGIWSGTGVINGYFYPQTSGQGVFDLKYTLTSNGCVVEETTNVTVYENTVVFFNDINQVCLLSGSIDLTQYVSINGGQFSWNGGTGNIIDPQTLSLGNHTITYTYINSNNCETVVTSSIDIVNSPSVSINSINEECSNGSVINLQDYVSPNTGTFSGVGVSGTNYNPKIAGVGIHTITYVYTTGNGCSDTKSFDITVNEVPQFTINPFNDICSNGAIIDLSPFTTQAGGTWSGTGVNNNFLDPLIAGLGVHSLTYEYSEGNCTDSKSGVIKINSPPTTSFNTLTDVCIEGGLINLSNKVNPQGGTFSGIGISGTEFDPITSGKGIFKINYSYIDANACRKDIIRNIEVLESPNVGLSPFLPICNNASTITLTEGTPAGGIYSGDGVIGGKFYPSLVTPGDYIISYKFEDNEGCSETVSSTITVNPSPSSTLLDFADVCVSDDAFILSGGMPLGGMWTGNGVYAGTFSPAVSGVGVQIITYSYTDPSTNCSSIANKNIIVKAIPPLTFNQPNATCINSGIIQLNGVSPIGGTFAGTGVSGYDFNPSVAGIGLHPVIYTYNDPGSGCSVSKTRNVQVFAVDNIVVTNVNPVCVSNPDFELTNGFPTTGTYSGDGVSGGRFYPQSAGVGTHIISYSITANSCFVEKTFTIEVRAEPIILHADFGDACVNQNTIQLTGGNPANGTYSGNGVSNNFFDASQSGIGVHSIIYTYTDPLSNCSNTVSKNILVKSLPAVNISALSDICLGEAALELTVGSPAGGTYSGNGISAGFFDPAVAGVGTHTVSYEYIDQNTGCDNSTTTNITVISSPVAGFAPIGTGTVCKNISQVNLNQGSPSGGIYSGNGIINGYFYPSIAGVGIHTLKYTVNNGNCISNATRDITVESQPIVVVSDFSSVCLTTPIFQLSGATPPNGTWSGDGVTNGYFESANAGVGVHSIIYDFTDNSTGCSATVNKTLIVNNNPNVSILTKDDVCENEGSVLLDGASPLGGTWSGNGVSGNIFDPAIAGNGVTILTYEYSDLNGCKDSKIISQMVNEKPNTSLAPFLPICENTANYLLTGGLPNNGTYSGNGVIGGYYYPAQSGVGNHTITYEVTNGNGCSFAASKRLSVSPSPVTTLADFNPVCVNSSQFILSGGTPINGTWSGAGVTNGIFNPSNAGVGAHAITYSYQDGNNGCENAITKNIIVKTTEAIAVATINPLCENSTEINLMSYVSPSGGTFSGIGITDSLFDPSIAGQGTFTITYEANSGITGCTSSQQFQVQVNPSENIAFQPILDVCLSDATINLTTGTPSGGIYKGPGVITGDFYPSVAGVGTHEISYTISNNGCAVSSVQNILVQEGTPVSLADFNQVCVNQSSFILTGGIPNGGIYTGTGVNAGFFDPANSGLGVHQISYTYTDPVTGCNTIAIKSITVINSPSVSLADLNDLCNNDHPINLTSGLPLGGSYTGTGVSGGLFNPSVAGAGTYQIFYLYSDGNGCSSTISKDITVNASPTTTVTPLLDICANGSEMELTGGNPSNGVYSGNAVIAGHFYPTISGVGTHQITYSVTNGNGCLAEAKTSISVKQEPSLSVPSFSDVCVGNQAFILTGATPSGGTWTGMEL